MRWNLSFASPKIKMLVILIWKRLALTDSWKEQITMQKNLWAFKRSSLSGAFLHWFFEPEMWSKCLCHCPDWVCVLPELCQCKQNNVHFFQDWGPIFAIRVPKSFKIAACLKVLLRPQWQKLMSEMSLRDPDAEKGTLMLKQYCVVWCICSEI